MLLWSMKCGQMWRSVILSYLRCIMCFCLLFWELSSSSMKRVTTALVADALSACAPQGTHITRVIPVNLQTCEPENKLLFQPLILGWLLHRINVAVNDLCYPFTHVSRKGDIKIGNGFRLRAMTECEARVMITFGRIFRPKLKEFRIYSVGHPV